MTLRYNGSPIKDENVLSEQYVQNVLIALLAEADHPSGWVIFDNAGDSFYNAGDDVRHAVEYVRAEIEDGFGSELQLS